MITQNFLYVWEPDVTFHLMMGWCFTTSPLIYEDRGGQPTWLMQWLCLCKMPRLQREQEHAYN